MTTVTSATPKTNRLYSVWTFAQHELLFVVWGIMDVALVTPIALILMSWARYWTGVQTFFWLLLVMLLAFNMVRLMTALNLAPTQQRNLTVIALLTLLLLTTRTFLYPATSLFDLSWLTGFYRNLAVTGNIKWARDMMVFFLTMLLWWRGIRLGTRSFTLDRAGLRLRSGVLVFVPFTLVYELSRFNESIVPYIMLFFLAGLTAVALIRAEEIEKSDTGTVASLGASWLLGIFGAALLVVFTSGMLVIFISGDSATAVAGWLAPLWSALYLGSAVVITTTIFLLTPLIYILAILIDYLGVLLQNLLSGVLGEDNLLLIPDAPFATPEAATEEVIELITTAPPETKLITILIIVAGVLIVAIALRRLYQEANLAASRRTGQASGRQKTTIPRASFGDRLRQQFGLLRNWRTAASIRRIYQEMVAAATAVGFPRSESETPYEYLHTLHRVWPSQTNNSMLITEAYVKIRYGEYPETAAELDIIKQAWQQLQTTEPVKSAESAVSIEKKLPNERRYHG